MKASCNITIKYDDEKTVQMVHKSIEVDNFDFVSTKITKNQLEVYIESKSVPSLLHTLDDYLACVSVAEKVVDKN